MTINTKEQPPQGRQLLLKLISIFLISILTSSLQAQELDQEAMDKALANALADTSGAISSEQEQKSITEHINDRYKGYRDDNGNPVGIVQNAVITTSKEKCDTHNGLVDNLGQLHKVAVFEKDNRQQAKSKESGSVWCYHKNSSGGKGKFSHYGSATIIDPSALGIKSGSKGDVITTAEHVLKNEDTGEEYYCEFWPKHNRKAVVKISNAEYGGFHRTNDRQDDWAVATIPKISDKKGYGAIPIVTDLGKVDLKDKMALYLQAYDKDHDRISFADRCAAYEKGEGQLLSKKQLLGTHCDANGGGSGGMLGAYYNDGQKNTKGTIGIYFGNLYDRRIYSNNDSLVNGIPAKKEEALGGVIKYESHVELQSAIISRAKLTN